MNNRPWRHKWDRRPLNGVVYPKLKRFEYEQIVKSPSDFKPYEKWDMMKSYRESIHDDDQVEIFEEIKSFEKDTQSKRDESTAAKKLVRARDIPNSEKSNK